MTTPEGTPGMPNAVRHIGFQPGDAAVQANPSGGGQYTGGAETRVLGSNQDVSTSGSPDARSGLATQKANVANKPGPTIFTAED